MKPMTNHECRMKKRGPGQPAATRRQSFVIRRLGALALCLLPAAVRSAPVSFSRDLAPLLADKCLECHREKKAKGKYRVDSFRELLKPGSSGDRPVTPGRPEASTLLARLVSPDEDERMPQKGDALSGPEIDLFRRWINEGAKFDAADAAAALGDLPRGGVGPGAPAKYPRPVPVTALALGGEAILYTAGYHELLEWSLPEGRALRRIPGMPERILALSLHRDGEWLAVAGGSPGRSGECLLVSRRTGAVLRRLAGAKDTFLAAAFSPDGSALALAGTDNTVRVFRGAEWKQVWKAEAHADWVMALAFSPDGRHLASASRDRTARVFAVRDGAIEFTFTEHRSAVLSAAFDPEGATVLTGAGDGEVRRWSWQVPDSENQDRKDTKEKKKPVSVVLKSKRQEVIAMAAGGGNLFTASSDGRVRVYDLGRTGEPRELAALGARASSLGIDGKGSVLCCGSQDGRVLILDPARPEKVVAAFRAAPGW